MRKALAIVAAALACSAVATPASAGVGDNMDVRTRVFVRHLHQCETITKLAINTIAGGDSLAASQAVNEAKSACGAIRDWMARADTRHFVDQALDAEVAVDYWTRGLGRVSNYIDNRRPSDVAKAQQYFATAHAERVVAIRGINARRAVYGLRPLK